MEITHAQYEQSEDWYPRQRGNVRLKNLDVLNAILYVAEQGCKLARSSETFRQLAHDLHADESLEQERCAGSGVSEAARVADCWNQDRSGFAGQHDC